MHELFHEIRKIIQKQLEDDPGGIGTIDVELFCKHNPPDHEEILSYIVETFPFLGIDVIHRLIPTERDGELQYRLTWRVYY